LSSAPQPDAKSNGTSRGWLDAFLVYRQRPVLSMLFLGFSAGLPFYLVFQTLTGWLALEGVKRSTIGMLSWVGLAYSFKFLWAPVVDRVPLPFITRWLGRRRSWMLLAQAGIAVCLFNMSWAQPSAGVFSIALWALLLAICAATQDIAIDAWRIESVNVDLQGAMAAAYQIGYRIALISASAGAFTIADNFRVLDKPNWQLSYGTMAVLAFVGVVTTLLVREPHPSLDRSKVMDSEERVIAWLNRNSHLSPRMRAMGAWFIGAVVCPVTDFFTRYGLAFGLVIFAFICSYRLTEYTMGPMANPFYLGHGYTLTQIATVVKAYGLAASLVGVVIAGALIARFGLLRSLIAGSVLMMASNFGFAWLATTSDANLTALGFINGLDNLAQAVHGTSLIAFLSSLTSPRYTATQYALFSSLYSMPAKLFFEGTSGFVVEAVGYPVFFSYTALLSIPGLLLIAYLVRRGGVFKTGQAAAA
jgi:MFS transporter, PAT family, beta-lactamase induction signal transducer AmpG